MNFMELQRGGGRGGQIWVESELGVPLQILRRQGASEFFVFPG